MEKKFSDIFYEKFNAVGYQIGDEITTLDDDLLNIVYNNNDLNLDIKKVNWNFDCDKLINISKNFYKSLFKLHNIKYLDEESVDEILFFGAFDLLNDEFLNVIDETTIFINPFDLSLNEDDYSGLGALYLNEQYYFRYIDLANINQRGVIPSYIHEIAHTQLMSNKGSILNYKNQEVLPIFIELLASKNIDYGKLLNNSIKLRFKDTLVGLKRLRKNEESNEALLEASGYIESSLIAMDLFDLYCSSNQLTQREILKKIQLIFDGKVPLEKVLDNYDLNYEVSKKKNLFRKYLK